MHIDSTDTTLKRYLEDIRRTAPLSREEEQILFQRAKEGDKIARKRLISANMRFVLKVAIQYRGCPIPLPDLVSEGAMGLVRAIESFEHTRGLKFISYGVWWIKAYITRAINEQGNLIRLPANQHLRVRKALHEQSRGKEINVKKSPNNRSKNVAVSPAPTVSCPPCMRMSYTFFTSPPTLPGMKLLKKSPT